MKNIAKLALFFSLSFIIVLLIAAGFRYLSLHIEWARNLPQKNGAFLAMLADAALWALSLALYASVLLTLSYAARRKYFALITIIVVMILSVGLNLGFSFVLQNWKIAISNTAADTGSQTFSYGGKGLILSSETAQPGSAQPKGSVVVLLNGMADPAGPRVTAMPGRALNYQESSAGTSMSLPPVPFGYGIPRFLDNFFTDIGLNAEQIQKRVYEGLPPYFMYTGALVFLLCSLGFIMKISVWPLANLFLGILAFRGILAVETFLNSSEIQAFFHSILRDVIPAVTTVPVILAGFGLLIYIYSILVYITKRQGNNEYS